MERTERTFNIVPKSFEQATTMIYVSPSCANGEDTCSFAIGDANINNDCLIFKKQN